MADFLSYLDSLATVFSGDGFSSDSDILFSLSCGLGSVTFPVNPSSYEIKNPHQNSTININAIGEMNMMGKAGLRTLEISSFFPEEAYGWEVSYPSMDPYAYVSTIMGFKEEAEPCTITVSGTDVSMKCTIESFSYGEKDGTGDVYFSLSLKEYRDFPVATQLQADTANGTGVVTSDYSKFSSKTYASGLYSRTSVDAFEKQIIATPAKMDSIDMAAKAVRRTVGIARQSIRRVKMAKALLKGGKIRGGTIMNVLKAGVRYKDGKWITKW